MNTRPISSAALLAMLAGSVVSLRAQAQSTEPFPVQFELSSLLPINGGDGSVGFVLNGIDSDDHSGRNVYSVGDVNDDGIDDLLITAGSADPNGITDAGECYVVFGGAGVGSGGVVELSSLDGSNGFVLNGIDRKDFAAWASPGGDVNGDGVADLVIGARGGDPNGKDSAGECYVIFGGAGVGSTGVIELADLNGSDGFTLNGVDAYDFSGGPVSSAGDINGDGFGDLIIGAIGADLGGDSFVGEAYVVFGGLDVGSTGVIELASLNGTNGFTLRGVDSNDQAGGAVASIGDVNGDGFDDLIIGADQADKGGSLSVGESYVVFGGAGVGSSGVIELASLNGTNGFTVRGIRASDLSGDSVSSAGDMNDDGFADLVIGAYWANPNFLSDAGESYVIFGGAGVGSGGVIELSDLDGSDGFAIRGIGEFDRSGDSVASAGDVNNDGYSDLIIGASWADGLGLFHAGESYVVFGGPDVGSAGVLELSTLDGINGFTLNGIDMDDECGGSVSSAGDLNGDGIDDLVIGASDARANGNRYAGESYVVFGRDLAPCTVDFNGDGILDLGDIQAFVGLFLSFDPAVDMNGDGIIDLGDINAFIGAFLEGC